MVKSEANPEGTPIEAFGDIRAAVLADRSQFYQDLSAALFGTNREGSTISQRARRVLAPRHARRPQGRPRLRQSVFRNRLPDDLKSLEVPLFIAHDDDDQIVPTAASAQKSAELVKHSTLKAYPEAPHGIGGPYQEAFDTDLLEFISN